MNGSHFFRKDSLYSHEKSVAHLNNVAKFAAKKEPSKSIAAVTRKLNEYTVKQLSIKFRSVHYL